MPRNAIAAAVGLFATGIVLVAVSAGGAAAPPGFQRHQFNVSISWSQVTRWEYKYARRFATGCNPQTERRNTHEGSGQESWKLTARRPGLLNVDFSRHAYYRGRPVLTWATRHTVDLVRERSGSLERVTWCGTTAALTDKASRSKCGRVAFPIFMAMEIPLSRRNVVSTDIWPAGNRSWQREKAMVKDCPNPPYYAGGTYMGPDDLEPRDVGGMFGAPLVFLKPFRWDALKNKARKRFVIPLTYSSSFTYPPLQPSEEPGETESHTGKLTTTARGQLILTRKK